MYTISGISRQGFRKSNIKAGQDGLLWQRLRDIVSDVRIGYPHSSARKIHYMLGINEVGINRFERFVSEQGLGIKKPRSFIRTTYSGNIWYPNLVNGIQLNGTNQLWASDLTYFITPNGTLYIVLIMDVYSRRIIGYSASDNMMVINNLKALEMAFKARKQNHFENLIHHSDKGSQYGSNVYVSMLEAAGIRISMAETCLENPYAERINGIIKNDYLIAYNINTFQQLEKALRKSIKLYNNYPHGELGLKSPLAFERFLGELVGSEYPVMQLYDFRQWK
nr:IS3 family transposase [Bacteroidota bacterium]